MSSSPFADAVVFSLTQPSITSVTISPSSATVTPGQNLQLTATVNTTGFANKAVQWTLDSTSVEAGVDITEGGLLKVPAGATGTITVTATSIYDVTKSATATITIA